MDEALKLENYSYDDYLDIDSSTKERVELIFGTIHMMAGASASHQDAVGNVFFILKNISKAKKRCFPRIAPFDIKLTVDNSVSVVQPDVMLFCKSDELPCAIFEVLSPSTAYKDKSIKKELYEKSGVREYFLVNVEYRTIDKFILKRGKYSYDRVYGVDDKIEILCLEQEVNVLEVFE
ncbi:Uma2 family endonuclease [Sulfurovum sp. bin170]|uniref:Uma2 family endonuclease n=1 Tax=Sulfurovum sp. bin170 TaxID=2695268 RepID=UPI0013E015FF|nr:Uma2 family endonuclease [Sulfurovum sp. bin170]NEW61138.1 Uma2 family endonuclease [Sulfurovum sp. bin170]